MNTTLRTYLCFCSLAVACSLARAQPAPPPPAGHPPGDPGRPGPGEHFERRFFARHDELGEKEPSTFLGVETIPVSPTLTAQLGLSNGAGLVVRHVVPDSPAAAALQPHDILLKMDDQILIEPRQFSVLVRNHKEGDEVTLTYVRAGKQTSAKVKLAKHDLPKMAFFLNDGNAAFISDDMLPPGRGDRESTDHVLALVGPHREIRSERIKHVETDGAPGFRATKVNPGNSNLVYSDEKGALDLTIKDGVKTLVAKNPKGEQVFSGPVTTPEERKTLPPELRDRLEKLEGMQDFSFKTDDDFRDRLRDEEPGRMKIVLPLRAGPDGEGSPGAIL